MSSTLYTSLWVIYLIAGVLLLWMAWAHTRWKKARWLGNILLLLFVVLVFTPAKLYQQPEFFVPATISLAFDQILGRDEAAFAASVNLIVATIICSLIFIIYSVVLRIVHSRKKNSELDSEAAI